MTTRLRDGGSQERARERRACARQIGGVGVGGVHSVAADEPSRRLRGKMGNGPRLMWNDMTQPVSLEEYAGVPAPAPNPDQPHDVSESVTVEATRPTDLERPDIAEQRRQQVVGQATRMIGNTDYQQIGDPNTNVGGLTGKFGGVLAAKCNIFVGDTLASAGIDVRDPSNRKVYLTTKAWGDPKAQIPGFQALGPKDKLRPGDIVAAGRHVGIYAPDADGKPKTISAASAFKGNAVVRNDWGFRGNEGAVTRWRYVGPGGKAEPPKWPTPIPPYPVPL